ncbi:hypothetical protein C7212DRAFT_343354 [Tuber magnatum]|uniref:Uncharacterized protein n=1 Tax=Tuber magnatum TaxID=42249 RepID=A0A317SUF3_9PEZI|nr:hypothetical protein C7212DRAFT_343354 [Tuber magnatum]
MVKQQNQRQQMRHKAATVSIVEQASVAQNREELCDVYLVIGKTNVRIVTENGNRDELPQQVEGIEVGLPRSSLLEGRVHVLEREVAIEPDRVHGLEAKRRQGNIYKTCHLCL